MKFACPHCGQRLEADAVMVGREIPCPTCSANITIPSASALLQAVKSEKNSKGIVSVRALIIAAAGLLTVGVTTGALFALTTKGTSNNKGPKPAELTDLKAFPPELNLSTKQDKQSLVVQATYADGVTRDVTSETPLVLKDKTIARLDKNTVSPLADGKTELTVKLGNRSLTLPVVVQDAQVDRPISFKLDVMPVFLKAGCNAGSCHGSSRGKDGFRLSLFGYDPDGDYHRLTRESIGRRVNLAIPEESLVVEKALGRVTHTGGERFTTNSPLYSTLLQWLQAGAPKDPTNIAKVVALEIMPTQAVLEGPEKSGGQGASQRLTVRARYSDGTDRDVTSLAVFSSNNEIAAKVSDVGVITAGQRGEAFVMARFDTFNVGAQIIVVPKNLPYTWPSELAEYNYIDKHIHAKLKKLRILPSELCDDNTFVRRAYLDITGTLPTVKEVEKFLDERSAGKRDQLINDLLERKEFADFWVMKFAELLQIRSRNDQFSAKSALQYYNWLQDRMTRNVSIDEIVRELITASGSTFKNPAANYYQVERDPLKTAENTAQVFMGMRIQCSQCHNHPFDRWTMNDYYSFASFFSQVGRKSGEDPREYVIFDRGEGEVKHPVTGKGMPPKFLGGPVADIKDESRREALAKWLVSPDNPYFAKNLANIVWAHFMGRGIIDPVDDVRISNPAVNPELLDALGAKFTEYKFDFKKLVRDICTSRTYQLSTRANESNKLDDRNFAKASIRRMRAEVLLDCISQVTETRDKFQGLPKGARAVEIADGNSSTYFLTTFGRARRETVCSCEVKTEPNLSQALHLLNGSTVSEKINEGGVVKAMLKSGKKREEVVEDLYVRCFARKPAEEEMTKLVAFFKDPKEDDQVLTDVFWSLLNSKEFIFNH